MPGRVRKGFMCPDCGTDKTEIKGTMGGATRVKRWRECNTCGHRFTTFEVHEKELELLQRIRKSHLKALTALAELSEDYEGIANFGFTSDKQQSGRVSVETIPVDSGQSEEPGD